MDSGISVNETAPAPQDLGKPGLYINRELFRLDGPLNLQRLRRKGNNIRE